MAVDGQIFRATVHYIVPNSSDIQNVFYWEYQGGATANQNVLDAIVDWLTNGWGDRWIALASTDAVLDSVEVIGVNPDGTTQVNVGSEELGLVGIETSDILTGVVSMFLQADTATPGHKGRKYVPGLGDSDVVDGLIGASQLVTMLLLLGEWLLTLTAVGPGELVPGLLSRTLVQFLPFLDAGSITDVPAYQRRRKPNVGS